MRHRIRSGAIITRNDSILLVQSNSDLGLKWWTPGGRVDGAESWSECATRETFEETGIEIEIGPLSGLSNVRAWLGAHGYDPTDPESLRVLFDAAKLSDHTLTHEEIRSLLEED